MLLSQERLKEVFNYDVETGVFTWRISSNGRIKIGSVAGEVMAKGYIRIQVDGKRYLAHKLAWLYITGSIPDGQMDHINQDKGDNSYVNLRLCTQSQNKANCKAYSNNESGYKGVYRAGKRWVAQIRFNKKLVYLGTHINILDAAKAYNVKAIELFGDFAYTNAIKDN